MPDIIEPRQAPGTTGSLSGQSGGRRVRTTAWPATPLVPAGDLQGRQPPSSGSAHRGAGSIQEAIMHSTLTATNGSRRGAGNAPPPIADSPLDGTSKVRS